VVMTCLTERFVIIFGTSKKVAEKCSENGYDRFDILPSNSFIYIDNFDPAYILKFYRFVKKDQSTNMTLSESNVKFR
jgi:hypothetical protein